MSRNTAKCCFKQYRVCVRWSYGSEACFLPQLSIAKSVSTNYTPLLVTTGFMAPETATSPCAGVSVWQNYKLHLSTSDSVHKSIRPQQRILAAPLFFFFLPLMVQFMDSRVIWHATGCQHSARRCGKWCSCILLASIRKILSARLSWGCPAFDFKFQFHLIKRNHNYVRLRRIQGRFWNVKNPSNTPLPIPFFTCWGP